MSDTYDQGTAAIGKLTSSIERQLDAGGTAQSVELDYTHDGAQNILSIGQMMSSTPNSFTYDKLSRLLSATVNHDGYEHSFTYTYDDFGNVLTRSESVPSGYSTLKAYIRGTGSVAPDPYVEAVDFAAPASGEIGTGSLGPNNRLMSVVRGGGATGEAQTTVNFQYDANGSWEWAGHEF